MTKKNNLHHGRVHALFLCTLMCVFLRVLYAKEPVSRLSRPRKPIIIIYLFGTYRFKSNNFSYSSANPSLQRA